MSANPSSLADADSVAPSVAATDALHARFMQLRDELSASIVGQSALVERLLIALLADGHLLVEGAPGLAKTTAVKALAARVEADFQRVQFTPDLLPSDLTGTDIWRQQDGRFEFQPGPLFHNLLLADEINRAPAKVQSALLEAMGERQITVGGKTYALPQLFLVMATQNPIEQEGTYPLPEAQTDRFLMKVSVDYPSQTEERQILDRALTREIPTITPVLDPAGLARAQTAAGQVHMDERIKDYCVALVRATRDTKAAGISTLDGLIELGASPRASIALAQASRAQAFLEGRGFVTPQDVKTVAPDVLRHRVVASYEAEAENVDSDALVARLLEHVAVP